jgi:hypothetical protein
VGVLIGRFHIFEFLAILSPKIFFAMKNLGINAYFPSFAEQAMHQQNCRVVAQYCELDTTVINTLPS